MASLTVSELQTQHLKGISEEFVKLLTQNKSTAIHTFFVDQTRITKIENDDISTDDNPILLGELFALELSTKARIFSLFERESRTCITKGEGNIRVSTLSIPDFSTLCNHLFTYANYKNVFKQNSSKYGYDELKKPNPIIFENKDGTPKQENEWITKVFDSKDGFLEVVDKSNKFLNETYCFGDTESTKSLQLRKFAIVIYDLLMLRSVYNYFNVTNNESEDNAVKKVIQIIEFQTQNDTDRIFLFKNILTDARDTSTPTVMLLQEVKTRFISPDVSHIEDENKLKAGSSSAIVYSKDFDVKDRVPINDINGLLLKDGKSVGDIVVCIQTINNVKIMFVSIHAETNGSNIVKDFEAFIEYFKKSSCGLLVIGADTNAKTDDLKTNLNQLINFYKGKAYTLADNFGNLYNTSVGKRTLLQSQFTKSNLDFNFNIDLIAFFGKEDINEKLKVTLVEDFYKTIERAPLTQTNPSDHVPLFFNVKFGDLNINILSKNMAGPNSNILEYESATPKSTLDNQVIISESILSVRQKAMNSLKLLKPPKALPITVRDHSKIINSQGYEQWPSVAGGKRQSHQRRRKTRRTNKNNNAKKSRKRRPKRRSQKKQK